MNVKLMTAQVLLLSALTVPALPGAQYLQSKPLKDVVSTEVGEVKPGVIQLPVITWGGDIATLQANGGAVSTQPGSSFETQKLKFKLVRKDVFSEQVQDFISGQPYLRGTVGMINQALSALTDPRVRPVVIYQLTWSSGGDVLVVRPSVRDAAGLKGKTIVVQAYGPHVDFLVQTLQDAGVDLAQVNLKYVKDITGTDNSPAEAFRTDPSVDAAFVISPDAADLTGGPGKTGTGAEKTVKGARALMSTRTADHVIADVYAVRADYLRDHPGEVESFVHALMNGQEQLADLAKAPGRKAEYDKLMAQAALVFLDTRDALDSAKGLLGDCTFAGYQGNVKFFTDPNYPRRFEKVSAENQAALVTLGLLSGKSTLNSAGFDYERIKAGLRNTAIEAESPRFDASAVASLVARRGEALNSVFSFEVLFEPNMAQFEVAQYKEQFDKVISMVSTYDGAILTVEGHTDPNNYLKLLHTEGALPVEIKQSWQVNLNKSLERANRVRDELLEYARQQSILVKEDHLTTVGYGCSKPRKGVEKAGPFKGQPVPSLTQEEWRANMRVVFRIINVEAEAGVFTPVKQ